MDFATLQVGIYRLQNTSGGGWHAQDQAKGPELVVLE